MWFPDNVLCQPERLTVEQERLKRFSNKITVSVLLQKIPSGPHLSLRQYEYNAVITVLSNKIKTKEIDRKLINQLI